MSEATQQCSVVSTKTPKLNVKTITSTDLITMCATSDVDLSATSNNSTTVESTETAREPDLDIAMKGKDAKKATKSSPNLLNGYAPCQNTVHRQQPISLPRSHTFGESAHNDLSPSTSITRRSSYRTPATLWRHLCGFEVDVNEDAPLEDVWSVATKRRGVYNLIQVPYRLERLLFFGQAICLHDFLAIFTFLPVRLIVAVIHLTLVTLLYPFRVLYRRCRRTARVSDADGRSWTRTLVSYAIDAQHASLLVLTALVLHLFDTSRIYHNIRGQSAIKLYVVFNVIEIFDRLCSSFGVDMLDSLGWTTASAVAFLTRRSGPSPSPGAAAALQAVVLLMRMAFDYVFALAYAVVHATLLLTWVVTLNVSINTQNNALLTLLVSNNFVELKSSAFKTFKVPNVFQISCSDAVERFQLTIFLAVMIVVTGGDERLFYTWAVIYGCEIAVDWIKHAFMLKFNRLSHRVYRRFGLVVCEAMIRTRAHSIVRSVGGSAVTKRIGFVSLPLAALVVRMVLTSVLELPLTAIGIMWLILVCIKSGLGICLIGHAWRRTCSGCEDGTEEDRDRDDHWLNQLMQVERYDLISKN